MRGVWGYFSWLAHAQQVYADIGSLACGGSGESFGGLRMCPRSHSRDCAGPTLWTPLRMRSTTRLFLLKLCQECEIQLLCVRVLYSYGVTWDKTLICDVNKSHGPNARFWLVETNFAALWLVSTQRGHIHYWSSGDRCRCLTRCSCRCRCRCWCRIMLNFIGILTAFTIRQSQFL